MVIICLSELTHDHLSTASSIQRAFFTMAPSINDSNVHQQSFDDSDNDSAISSQGSSQGSKDTCCSCDSCICDLSFSTCDSDTESCFSPINPFGSFRHTGVLPYSLFEDSSSFSCSNVNQTSTDCSQNSTHIYINLLDQTNRSIVKTTKFWTSLADEFEDTILSARSACDGKEDTTLVEETLPEHCNMHDISTKVGPWLQNCLSIMEEVEPVECPTDTSVNSDAATFLEQPLHHQPVTHKLSSKKRLFLVKKLKDIRRFLQRQGKSKKTPAVI